MSCRRAGVARRRTSGMAGRGGEHVLGEAALAGTSRTVGLDVLRECDLDAVMDRVPVLPLLGLLVEPVSRLDVR